MDPKYQLERDAQPVRAWSNFLGGAWTMSAPSGSGWYFIADLGGRQRGIVRVENGRQVGLSPNAAPWAAYWWDRALPERLNTDVP